MWAQLIKTRLRPEHAEDLPDLLEQLRAIEQPDSGLIRTTAMVAQNDPTELYLLVVLESEEKARAREQDPRRQEGLKAIQEQMARMIAGEREFVDLTVVSDVVR